MQTGIKANDCEYVDLYNDYLQMRDTGNKMTYIVAMLSDKYNVSERQVYSIIDRLKTAKVVQCNPVQKLCFARAFMQLCTNKKRIKHGSIKKDNFR